VLELDLLSAERTSPGHALQADHAKATAAAILATVHGEPVDFVTLRCPPGDMTPDAVRRVLTPQAAARIEAHERADRNGTD